MEYSRMDIARYSFIAIMEFSSSQVSGHRWGLFRIQFWQINGYAG
jgi:hypothetical protein